MKPLEAYAATCPNIPNIPKKYLASKMHSAKGAQVPLQLTSAALAPQVAAQGNLRLLTNFILNDIQWIFNDQYSIPKHCQIKEIDVEMLLWYLHPASDPVLQKSLAKPTWQVLVWLDGLAIDLARAEKCWRSHGETQKTSGHNAYKWMSQSQKVRAGVILAL